MTLSQIRKKMSWGIILLAALAVFLRLYNLPGNFTIGGDGARDVMIAHEAIRRGELPLTGPFTSAGPFVFGPFFYWLVIFAFLFLPFGLLSPWVLVFVIGVTFVLVMAAIGNLLGGKRLAIFAGLLAATSPQMILRSRALTQHTVVALATSLVILFYILLWQKKRLFWAFLLGIGLGIAVSLHYQALNLLFFLPAIFLIPKVNWRKKIFYSLAAFGGFFLLSLPIIIWDSQQNFANLRNILDYLLIGQYRIYVPTSWKLFLFQQFPNYFSFVAGGVFPVGVVVFFASVLYSLRQRGVTLVIAGIYLVLLLVNRYYRGERFEGYLIYFAPFILLFTAIFLSRLGSLFLVVVLVFNVWSAVSRTSTVPNNYLVARHDALSLWKSYGYKKLSIYQNNANSSEVALPLNVTLSDIGAIDRLGIPLGVILDSSPRGYHLVDLRSSFESAALSWQIVDQAAIYDDLIGWIQKHQLQSSFDLVKYLQERL